MKYSANSLKTFSKCGHKWYLEKMENISEPGKRKYAALDGKVIHKAISVGSQWVFDNKTVLVPDKKIMEWVYLGYEYEFERAGVPSDILEFIQDVLYRGPSAENMALLDMMSHSINEGMYEFTVPPPLKTKGKGEGGWSTDKKRFGMLVQAAVEDVLWFFGNTHGHLDRILEASDIRHDYKHDFQIDDFEITAYYDEILWFGDDPSDRLVVEFKTDSTPYTPQWIQNSIQGGTYVLGTNNPIRWFDITHRKMFDVCIPESALENLRNRYQMMNAAMKSKIFIPACGSDPHTSKMTMCGFRGSCHCKYSDAPEIITEPVTVDIPLFLPRDVPVEYLRA